MRNKIYILVIFFSFIISGCGEVVVNNGTDNGSIGIGNSSASSSSTSYNNENNSSNTTTTLKIIGKITYDRVHVYSSGIGLDYNNITKEIAKQVVVKAIGSNGKVIRVTTTDDNGDYVLSNLPSNTRLKVRVYAKLQKTGKGSWDVKVVDNTNGNSQYVMESSFISLEDKSLRVNLNASTRWNGYHYTDRTAAPFAILGSIYQAMQKVLSADSNATFPALVVNWSKNNVASGNGSEAGLRDGQIVTSHFDGEQSLYILGDENSDTDEYDDHIIIHEWGHYFESKFSRADSIGGSHGAGEYLDIRVAFGEGWGNGWSAIATDNPLYYDTMGTQQTDGFSMDIENETPENPGWYSESSIQRILYDLYDSNDDGEDTLSLGFKPIYDVLVGSQKTTPAFTSIFSFITYLKKQNPSAVDKIDTILASENIEPIQDIYGSTIDNKLYIGSLNNVCTTSRYGEFNKLYTHRYIKFSIMQSGKYTVSAKQNNGNRSDPDFAIYKTTPFSNIGKAEETQMGIETGSYSLSSGDYLLDISDYNDLSVACFNITIK